MRAKEHMTKGRTRARSYFGVATSLLLPVAIFACNDDHFSWNEQFSHPEVSLTGSSFEIDTDANLKVDDASPSLDWANVTEIRKADEPTGATDDSFGQGTKEDTAVPIVVDGSIPPNKSDLLNFGVYLETTTSGRKFLNLFWHRVQEPSGTTNMDFEFNQLKTDTTPPPGNGVTPLRTAGDLLIQYDLSQGGTNPVLFVSRWVTTGDKSQCEAANSASSISVCDGHSVKKYARSLPFVPGSSQLVPLGSMMFVALVVSPVSVCLPSGNPAPSRLPAMTVSVRFPEVWALDA